LLERGRIGELIEGRSVGIGLKAAAVAAASSEIGDQSFEAVNGEAVIGLPFPLLAFGSR
jgi:hypothetical protein